MKVISTSIKSARVFGRFFSISSMNKSLERFRRSCSVRAAKTLPGNMAFFVQKSIRFDVDTWVIARNVAFLEFTTYSFFCSRNCFQSVSSPIRRFFRALQTPTQFYCLVLCLTGKRRTCSVSRGDHNLFFLKNYILYDIKRRENQRCYTQSLCRMQSHTEFQRYSGRR